MTGLFPVLACLCLLLALRDEHDNLQRANSNMIVLPDSATPSERALAAAHVVPSPRQLAWQKQEFIAFIHFGMNTFADSEWGTGRESPGLFNPTDLDARQWMEVLRGAGMKAVILTTKHHDGFCLWPSKFTNHSVKNSPWRNGHGDVVAEVAAACKEFGLKFGVYLSPWDRHEPSYGDSPRYNEFFLEQLRELLTNYGEIAEVWFDGACGEGSNGKKQIYDWASYYRLIRELQPNAVISTMGPDVRWVGTESGYGRETEWSVLPFHIRSVDSIAAGSQRNPVDGAFVPHDLTNDDLGSREKISHAPALVWYPAETDVSIRPGWFYHAAQNNRVKSPTELVNIFCSSVGRNSVLLLNVPPDRRGRIAQADIASLAGMRKILHQTLGTNLLAGSYVTTSDSVDGHPASAMIDTSADSYWVGGNHTTSWTVEFTMPGNRTFDRVVLREYFPLGQRVEAFHIETAADTGWTVVAGGTTIGAARILRFPPVTSRRLRLVIDQARDVPALSALGVHEAPPIVRIDPPGGAFQDSLTVRLSADGDGTGIRYTLDGTSPTLQSPLYVRPLRLERSSVLNAVAVVNAEACVEIASAQFIKCRKVRDVVFEEPYDAKYGAEGNTTVVNGKRGIAGVLEKEWLGFKKQDVIATLDLGVISEVKAVTAGFLQEQESWIFLPSSVQCAISDDGVQWKAFPGIQNRLSASDSVFVAETRCSIGGVRGRFVRVTARNIGSCPPWHRGAGEEAWIFLDEIIVE